MTRIEAAIASCIIISSVGFGGALIAFSRGADHISAPVPVVESDSPETQVRRSMATIESVLRSQREEIAALKAENWRLTHSSDLRKN